MLRLLKIKNFALIYDQTIEFDGGFNVLVGSTGAGKSLIIDAISFVLGEKANKLNIRTGEEKLSVQAVFDIKDNRINKFLAENDIDGDDSIIVSRSLCLDGKSDARINGTIVSVGTLKSFSSLLIDIYAQNENIELLNPKNHLSILDSYAKNEVLGLKDELNLKLDELKAIQKSIEELGSDDELRARKLELLEYQIKDIENANLKCGEDDELKAKIDKLANYERIFENVKQANDCLYNVNELLNSVEQKIMFASKYDESLNLLLERVKSNRIDLSDILDELKEYDDGYFDENELERLNARQDLINTLKRKYGSTLEDVLEYLNKTKEDYDNLLFGEERLNKLQKQKEVLVKYLYDLCVKLSNARQKVAKEIEDKVSAELKLLGFKNFNFKVNFADLSNVKDAVFTKNGLDQVEFLFSANAGEGLKSLAKTISGGEMSRFMLAIKNVFAKSYMSSTLIFDEVDTGVSGEIGQRVAERLANLSISSQVICITHLCQVTAMADKYIYVSKVVEDGKTFTKISYLQGDEIIKYIAEVSGAEPTQVAMQFASELKFKANSYKLSLKQ